jgi:hypothetical protein
MVDLSNLTVAGAVAATDIAGASTVVDVGGADGQFVLEVMAANPGPRGQVLDLPHAVGGARRQSGRLGSSKAAIMAAACQRSNAWWLQPRSFTRRR